MNGGNRSLWLVVYLIVAFLFLAACGDGGDTSPNSSPSPTIAGDLSDPRIGGVVAARQYLSDEGLDGDKGNLSDPIDCADLPDDGGDAEFCIIDDASIYAPGLVIVYVARTDNIEEDVWEVRVESATRGEWEVTGATPVGSE